MGRSLAIATALLLAAAFGDSPAQALTTAQCDADRGALLTEIARNRDAALDYYQDAMATAANPEVRAQLADQLQQVWDREETERRAAYLIWRDCTAHVKTLKAQKTKKAE